MMNDCRWILIMVVMIYPITYGLHCFKNKEKLAGFGVFMLAIITIALGALMFFMRL